MLGRRRAGRNGPASHGAVYSTLDKYLPDLIFGANDGIITTLAVVSGL